MLKWVASQELSQPLEVLRLCSRDRKFDNVNE